MISKKICMLGAFGVGKTSLVQRFVSSIFSDKYLTTVGVKIDKKQMHVNGNDILLMLWDMAGEDAVTQVKMSHLRGAAACILTADGTRGSTLDVARDLKHRAQNEIGSVPCVLAINKSDLRDRWEIRQEALDKLSAEGWRVFISSAKSGENVEELFAALCGDLLK
jgi:small GTP-binding protein